MTSTDNPILTPEQIATLSVWYYGGPGWEAWRQLKASHAALSEKLAESERDAKKYEGYFHDMEGQSWKDAETIADLRAQLAASEKHDREMGEQVLEMMGNRNVAQAEADDLRATLIPALATVERLNRDLAATQATIAEKDIAIEWYKFGQFETPGAIPFLQKQLYDKTVADLATPDSGAAAVLAAADKVGEFYEDETKPFILERYNAIAREFDTAVRAWREKRGGVGKDG